MLRQLGYLLFFKLNQQYFFFTVPFLKKIYSLFLFVSKIPYVDMNVMECYLKGIWGCIVYC